MPDAYAQELETAIQAVCAASRVCESVQKTITDEVLEKKDRSPVTLADFSSQAVVCRTIRHAFPDDPIIAEEDAAELRKPENSEFLTRAVHEIQQLGIDATAEKVCEWIDHGGASDYCDRFWTLDPIDGTKGFLRREQYAVSLALIVNGRIDVAVLACPNLADEDQSRGILAYAVRGGGSFISSLAAPESARPIRVSTRDQAAEIRFCESVESGHSAHDHSAQVAATLGIQQAPVRLDSQAKYAVVARGEAEVYLRLPTRADYNEKIWDHAGGVLVVEEAGGRVTDVAGRPLEFNHGRELTANRGVIVTNGSLHDRVLDALRKHGV